MISTEMTTLLIRLGDATRYKLPFQATPKERDSLNTFIKQYPGTVSPLMLATYYNQAPLFDPVEEEKKQLQKANWETFKSNSVSKTFLFPLAYCFKNAPLSSLAPFCTLNTFSFCDPSIGVLFFRCAEPLCALPNNSIQFLRFVSTSPSVTTYTVWCIRCLKKKRAEDVTKAYYSLPFKLSTYSCFPSTSFEKVNCESADEVPNEVISAVLDSLNTSVIKEEPLSSDVSECDFAEDGEAPTTPTPVCVDLTLDDIKIEDEPKNLRRKTGRTASSLDKFNY